MMARLHSGCRFHLDGLLAMSLNLVAGSLEVAGQRAGARSQQPEHEEADAVDAHAANIQMSGQHDQIVRVKGREKQPGGNT